MSFATEADAINDVWARIKISATHVASIAKSIQNGGPTEIGSMAGAIVRIAEQNGWAAEECARVLNEVRRVERIRAGGYVHEQQFAGAA
jgi:ketopantoate reductase